jgi:serine/threonine protein phosphatase PrpC
MLSNADIAEIISANPDDEAACRCLLALALDRKANDNVSIILCTAAAGE